MTRDGGKAWKDVTPSELTAWDKISQIDAGQHDVNTAYISVNAFRKDDLRPYIFKTTDGGNTWVKIVNGLPNEPVNVVREDPYQKGLLVAGTENAAYFSADAGLHWQSLKQNMPATSIRDLVIHEHDIVIGTHGRSIWVLDNLSPLRYLAQLNVGSATLFPPVVATRVRFNTFSDTPLPPEEPAGKNPPDGAVLDYFLPKDASQISIDIRDASGALVRLFKSDDPNEKMDTTALPYATYWFRKMTRLSTQSGHHRVIWDMSYPAPRGSKRELSIAATYNNTATSPKGIWVPPGEYTVTLLVEGKSFIQKLTVQLDPRVNAQPADIELQTNLSKTCYELYHELQTWVEEIDSRLADTKKRWPKGVKENLQAIRGQGQPENPDVLYGAAYETSLDKENLVDLQNKLLHVLAIMQSADAKPTAAVQQAVQKLAVRTAEMKARYNALR